MLLSYKNQNKPYSVDKVGIEIFRNPLSKPTRYGAHVSMNHGNDLYELASNGDKRSVDHSDKPRFMQ